MPQSDPAANKRLIMATQTLLDQPGFQLHVDARVGGSDIKDDFRYIQPNYVEKTQVSNEGHSHWLTDGTIVVAELERSGKYEQLNAPTVDALLDEAKRIPTALLASEYATPRNDGTVLFRAKDIPQKGSSNWAVAVLGPDGLSEVRLTDREGKNSNIQYHFSPLDNTDRSFPAQPDIQPPSRSSGECDPNGNPLPGNSTCS
jgi:hypothetical protein